MTSYTLKITTLSPLHIGEGEELRHGFDFATDGKYTYRLDVDHILEKYPELCRPPYKLPGSVLSESDLAKDEYFRYIIQGTARSSKTDARLQACIKDVHDIPYLPGSSIKGALRTALAFTGWGEARVQLDRGEIGFTSKSAGQKLEKNIFGRDPNHDLLRALQVSDCFTEAGTQAMFIANAQVITQKTTGSPISLEAIKPQTEFTGSLKIDDTLFSAMAEPELHFKNRRLWLDELILRVKQHSHKRIDAMLPWFEHADNAARVYQYLQNLRSFSLSKQQAILQLGWGTGWDGKTFWTHLTANKGLFEQLVSDFRMNRGAQRKVGDRFPRSRRVALSKEIPGGVFGWVLLELVEKR